MPKVTVLPLGIVLYAGPGKLLKSAAHDRNGNLLSLIVLPLHGEQIRGVPRGCWPRICHHRQLCRFGAGTRSQGACFEKVYSRDERD